MRRFTIIVLAVAAGLAVAVSPFASSSPDGLQRVAEDNGVLARGHLAPVQGGAPARGYEAPGIGDARIATGVAGIAGTLLVFVHASGAPTHVRRRGGVT